MTRQENVLDAKITLISVLSNYWKKSFKDVVGIFSKYSLFDFIDSGYEYLNSMGEQGIIEEIESYISLQKEGNS